MDILARRLPGANLRFVWKGKLMSGKLVPSSLWLLPLATGILAGCRSESAGLRLADLTPAERQYIVRFVTLERARAVAMVDDQRGDALLDSLRTAWGDSSLALTQRGLSSQPRRVAAVNDLLLRIMDAEQDSLLKAPLPRRLAAPLPEPAPARKPR